MSKNAAIKSKWATPAADSGRGCPSTPRRARSLGAGSGPSSAGPDSSHSSSESAGPPGPKNRTSQTAAGWPGRAGRAGRCRRRIVCPQRPARWINDANKPKKVRISCAFKLKVESGYRRSEMANLFCGKWLIFFVFSFPQKAKKSPVKRGGGNCQK